MKINKLVTLFLLFLFFGCKSQQNYKLSQVYFDPFDGTIKNGIPKEDSLINVKDLKGNVIGIGKVAVKDNNITDLRFGHWKEFDFEGHLVSEGHYKIDMHYDCGIEPSLTYYYYRVGEWKYYKKNGELDYELEFKPLNHVVDTNCGDIEMKFGVIDKIPIKYLNKVTVDKVYELQKISYSEMTFTPLNRRIHIEYIY
ncbi:hypothetical protein [Flammeovirga kamogawensis]|uniref:Uncharacterized protein n=1 Tax=Flammeovirga kamogawensis TaxID=373891 RepID=A0ABX8H3D2_9BACT|nr:hypothetical protein [Flammeovirga kamogawensis]QWG09921.1 hypothetical protein KM029_19765 [Flammeovirga kamogawensis]TRX65431.1 hypothetical protein EO216_23190 [Flammeovirga kamogawensis]